MDVLPFHHHTETQLLAIQNQQFLEVATFIFAIFNQTDSLKNSEVFATPVFHDTVPVLDPNQANIDLAVFRLPAVAQVVQLNFSDELIGQVQPVTITLG